MRTEVVVIGGGIVGCSAAAMLADRGARVTLVERTAIGAGASGRNLGAVQHPFDPVLAPLYHESLSRYRALAATSPDFTIGAEPAGLLLLNGDPDVAAQHADAHRRLVPELRPVLLSPDEVVALEPSLRQGPAGVRLETGYPIPPASATAGWAVLAEDRGATTLIGSSARPVVEGGRVRGARLDDGTILSADALLVAAGPWTPSLVDAEGGWAPIRPTYGVTVQIQLGASAPRHIIEEDEVDSINRVAEATARAADVATPEPASLFSVASAEEISTVGSTFLATEPDAATIAPLLLRRAIAFLPAVDGAEVVGRRMCARPQSIDGRPFVGRLGADGLFVCAGHGPWGISIGPASAAMAARAILDGTAPPPELAASRPY